MEQYTWIPAFKALTQWIKDYEDRQPELIAILQKLGIEKGLTDENEAGEKVPLQEIDPFSFFAIFMKYGEDTRKKLFKELIELIGLDAPPPSDFSGVPSAQPLKVWLFPYAKSRAPGTISKLWKFFRDAATFEFDREQFQSVLSIKGTGFAKLTQCLFYAYPDIYLPVDGQTRHWLTSNGLEIPKPNWQDYRECLQRVRNLTDKPFWEISYQAWYENQSTPFDSKTAVEHLKKVYPGTYSGTMHIAGFKCTNGKPIALDPKPKSVKVFIGDKPPEEIQLEKVREYGPRDTRNHHLKQHAPSLALGRTAFLVPVSSMDELDTLLEWYDEEDNDMSEPISEENLPQKEENIMPTEPLNQILYGPPGTGKTYRTTDLAVRIADPVWYQENADRSASYENRAAIKARFDELVRSERIQFTTFHQSFAYEDFIEGIRAESQPETDELHYPVRDGVFKTLCKNADKRVIAHQTISSSNLSDRAIWKMSLGNSQTAEAGEVFTECLENDYVLLGWGGDADFSGCDDYESVKKRYLERYPSETQEYAFRAVNTFRNQVKEGDLLVISDGNSRFRAIAEVTGQHRKLEDKPDWFHQARDVKWLQVYENSRPVSELYSSQFTQKTLYKLKPSKLSLSRLQEMVSTESPEEDAPPHVLIIDEINRGNIARIFGELITLLEPSKRAGASDAQSVTLPYSKEQFSVPSNVFVIGTMNTADKSLAQLDLALRRRFSFVEMLPDPGSLSDIRVHDIRLDTLLDMINQRIEVLLDSDHQIGHAYFIELAGMESESERQAALRHIFRDKVIPLLQEYFFEDYERIGWVLNDPAKAPEHKFIIPGTTGANASTRNLTDLFPGEIAEQLTDNRFKINESAFDEAEAYQQIVGMHR